MFIKILRWIFFGVILSILPFTLVVARNWLDSNEVSEINYILDLLLITLAVAVNALSTMTDMEKQIWQSVRYICAILSGLSIFFCGCMYFSYFENCFLNEKLLEQFMQIDCSGENILSNQDVFQKIEILKKMGEELEPKNEQLVFLMISTIVILGINSIIGIVVEVIDGCRKKKQYRDQHKNGGNENTIQHNVKEPT